MSFEDEFDREAEKVNETFDLMDLKDALRRANERLAKAKVTADSVAEAAMQGAYDAVLATPRPKVTPYNPTSGGRRAGKPEVAALHLTDWQGAKRTVSYNSEVMKQRVRQVLKNTMKLVEIQRSDHPVNDIIIMLGGDMIEGLFNFPTQPYEIDATLFKQFVDVATLLAEGARGPPPRSAPGTPTGGGR